jgi:hypothetical protein
MAAGGGGAAVNYAPNSGYVIDTAALVIGVNSVITYIIRNEEGERPEFQVKFGYAQEQVDREGSSTLSNLVTIEPGRGSTRKLTTFSFTTVSNETRDPKILNFTAGDGQILPDNILVPTGVEGINVKLDARNSEGPPAWFIVVDSSWFSSSTVVGTEMFKLTFELLGETNSVVTIGKAVASGASVYKYVRKRKFG